MKRFNFMHEYDLDRRTHAFFDSVSLVSPKHEKAPHPVSAALFLVKYIIGNISKTVPANSSFTQELPQAHSMP